MVNGIINNEVRKEVANLSDIDSNLDKLVERVADRVVERMSELFDENGLWGSAVGILVGLDAICRFNDVKTRLTMLQWYKYKGFPMVKDGIGRWVITKADNERWWHERGQIMRKGQALGFRAKYMSCCGSLVVPPEAYSVEQLDRIRVEMNKDRVRDGN